MSAALYGWSGYSQSDRTFHYAIAASLVLHALLLFVVPGLRETRSLPEPPGVLVAHIVESPQVQVTAPPRPEPVARPVEPPKPQVEPPPLRAPSPIAESAPAPAPQAAAAESPPVAVASVPATSVQVEPQPGPKGNLDLGSLRDYERRLSFYAGQYKSYPRVAIDNAWEGNVEVELDIDANGVLRSVKVKTSSGYNVLDQQAVDLFKRVKPLVPIPPALAGRPFTVTRLVEYKLTQGQ